ncbi:MAG: alpha/beta hydrolase [Pseudomonadota bacterium]
MRITDWDDAYSNRAHVPEAEAILARWKTESAAYRGAAGARLTADLAYGPRPRNRLDLFQPQGAPRGVVVSVHGGYWRMLDKSVWSVFAAGALDAGWAVAVPNYTLAPALGLPGIAAEIAMAVETAAAAVAGEVRLVGHSAGGHLVTRVMCRDSPLSPAVQARVAHTVSISGVHDLRPLLATEMAGDLRLDSLTAAAESPALLLPAPGVRATVWVGGAERPEFVRQSTLLANVWTGLGADMAQEKVPERHHFDIVDGLKDADSPLMAALLG